MHRRPSTSMTIITYLVHYFTPQSLKNPVPSLQDGSSQIVHRCTCTEGGMQKLCPATNVTKVYSLVLLACSLSLVLSTPHPSSFLHISYYLLTISGTHQLQNAITNSQPLLSPPSASSRRCIHLYRCSIQFHRHKRFLVRRSWTLHRRNW
jgi:hypothetical protein